MNVARPTPEATVYRLSLYHCYLGELLRSGSSGLITSRRLAEELGVREESIRRDISFMGEVGRPGAGYDIRRLFDALQEFLGLAEQYPIAKVGSTQMLQALEVVFPPDRYGVHVAACFSEDPEDAGTFVNDVEVRPLAEIADVAPALGIDVALVAVAPEAVQRTLELLHAGGVRGVLLLTPATRLHIPEGMDLHHVRMPCDIKSLACKCRMPSRT